MGIRSDLPGGILFVNGESVRGGFQVNMFAVKLQIPVADERAGHQAGLGEHLKTVADAEHESAVIGKLFHRLHHRD